MRLIYGFVIKSLLKSLLNSISVSPIIMYAYLIYSRKLELVMIMVLELNMVYCYSIYESKCYLEIEL
jgi:hypothetical protein